MHQYFLVFKPYGMLSQFTKEGEHNTLADLKFPFPKDAYPVGRLDADSEGLLLLTNDKSVNSKLLDPSKKHNRKYLVQVEGLITTEAIRQLEKGVRLNEKGNIYNTLPSKAEIIDEPELPERNPPVRFRKNIPTSWISLTIIEGKNRQVRKMTATVGFPALRLVRVSIEDLSIEKMENGYVQELQRSVFYSRLKLTGKIRI
jgi:23S rRNA pseudouridine2457 synthase